MIKIEVIKANKSSKGIDISTPVCNSSAEKIAENLISKVSNFKCENHPESIGIITIISTPNQSSLFEISKSNFCCKEFENSIQIQTK